MTTETKKKFDSKWLIPIGLALGSIYSGYRAIAAMHSNSTTQLPGGGVVDNTGNVGWFETGGGWFCVILGAAAIIISLVMKSEK